MNKLILDANAFIKEIDFNVLAEKYEFYTLPAVVSEVRDERARQKLNNFGHPLKQQNPSQQSIQVIKNFAIQTGDFASLSDTDMEILALAYELIESCGQKGLIKTTPLQPIEFNTIKNVGMAKKLVEVEDDNQDDNQDDNNQDDDNQDDDKQDDNKQDDDDDDGWIEVGPKKKFQKRRQQKEESDDDEGWINEENINEQKNFCEVEKKESEVKVGVVTSDFAMQNVLLQMGIPIISAEGYKIKCAKRFILECHYCLILVRDSTKLFCPICGNHSLLKVSCSLNADGTIILYRRKNFQVNLRGTQYDIPITKDKRDAPFIYCEDQLHKNGLQQQLARQKKQENQKYKKIMKTYENGVGFDESDFRKPKEKKVIGYGNLNPNDVNDMRKIKSKKNR